MLTAHEQYVIGLITAREMTASEMQLMAVVLRLKERACWYRDCFVGAMLGHLVLAVGFAVWWRW